jgi:hypothetical protein
MPEVLKFFCRTDDNVSVELESDFRGRGLVGAIKK